MKLFALLSFAVMASALTAQASAKTVLYVPFFVEFPSGPGHAPVYEFVPVHEVNKTLVKKGLSPQMESVELTLDTEFNKRAEFNKIDAALEAAGIEDAQAMGELFPQEYSTKDFYTCYRGDGNGVIDIVLSQVDNVYSDQYILLGWRLGKKVVVGESDDVDQGALDDLNKASKLWKNYDKKSDSVLILASVGDEGTDVQESLIPRCK